MINVKKEGILLMKTNLVFENEGVLNPAAIRINDDVHIFYRAVSNGNFSSIGYCRLTGPNTVIERLDHPVIFPEFPYELHGVEDPRVVKIEELYYLTYTAYDGINALGALAISKDLVVWKKFGLIVPQVTYEEFNRLAGSEIAMNEKYLRYNEHNRMLENQIDGVFLWDKNVIFFPKKINGKFNFLHRIKPDIQIVVAVTDLQELTTSFWQDYLLQLDDCIVLAPKYEHEQSYIGGGCPPIETEHGWLLIYHGVHDSEKGYIYSACAALLDINNPQKEIARLPYALFKPEFAWELRGEVNNVCFPTGAVLFNDTLFIYYGAADERIAYASVSLSALLKELLLNKKDDENPGTPQTLN
jgi:predicted GH43/DUF377 family glycosyl hydrolase